MERWGIKSFDDSGYINLHSDYSSIVYYGEMSKNTQPVRPTYLGDYAVGLSEATKTANYDMGWTIQYIITGISTEFLLPFYRPVFSGQQIGILDVIKKDAGTWLVNLIYEGSEYQTPRVFAFAPLNAIPQPTPETNGIQVFDQNGGLVFTGNKRPLRVDDVILIQHPNAIKTGDRGGCGDDRNCNINYNSDQSTTYTGTSINTSTKLYHMVPSAYGGLAYKNSDSGTRDCGRINLILVTIYLGEREFAWIYQSWASFRGTVGHTFETNQHRTDWLGDFAGVYHRSEEGGCKLSGFAGAILGAALAVFTLGAGLVFVAGGALAGFALSGTSSVPSIRAYDADNIFDTNNASNLIITDASYYGIDILTPPGNNTSGIGGDGVGPASIIFEYAIGTFDGASDKLWQIESILDGVTGNTTVNISIYYNGFINKFENVSAGTTSLTYAGVTYYRGNSRGSFENSKEFFYPYNTKSYQRYSIGRGT